MSKKIIDRFNPAIIRFALLLFFLCFFGQPEKASSKTAYLVTAISAMLAFFVDQLYIKTVTGNRIFDKRGRTVLYVFGSLFGLITVFANYEMYIEMPAVLRACVMLLLFISSGVVFDSIFRFCNDVFTKTDIRTEKPSGKPFIWFIASFLILSSFYLLIFFLCSFPGQICSDSLDQIKQTIYGNYSNHHPVYQTWLIGLFMKIGMSLIGDINGAVATYTIFQILFISGTYAFMISTLIQAGSKKIFAAVWLLWFLLTPCHIIFSFTLWKDSLYGAVVCIFTVSLFRIYKHTGSNKIFNYILLFLSGTGFCLLRSNGLPAFILLLVILAVLFFISRKKEERNIIICCLAALLTAVILKFPVLKAMDIPQADTVEMLSIPVQQITRIAIEKDDLTDQELYVIEQIASVERLKEQYNPKVYDYARDVIRYEGDQTYISAHPIQCFGTWFTIVMRHPVVAAKAWVDQTSGYWNPSGYYWMKWWDGVCEEEGLYLHVLSPKADEIFHTYVGLFESENSILGLTYNIGLHVWVIVLAAAYSIFHKRKEYILSLPVLTLVATLLIATLMHDEFRFGYPVYTCLPVIVFSCFGYKNGSGTEKYQPPVGPR